jgi:hypothetical protein
MAVALKYNVYLATWHGFEKVNKVPVTEEVARKL